MGLDGDADAASGVLPAIERVRITVIDLLRGPLNLIKLLLASEDHQGSPIKSSTSSVVGS